MKDFVGAVAGICLFFMLWWSVLEIIRVLKCYVFHKHRYRTETIGNITFGRCGKCKRTWVYR